MAGIALEDASSDASLEALGAPSGGAAPSGSAVTPADAGGANAKADGRRYREEAGGGANAKTDGRRYREEAGAVGSQEDDAGADAPVRSGTGRAYGLFLLGAAGAVFSTALLALFALVAAVPGTKRAAGKAASTAWRVIYSAVFTNVPRAVMIMTPFSFTFVMSRDQLKQGMVAIFAGWLVFYSLTEFPVPGAESDERSPLSVGLAILGLCILPFLMCAPVYITRRLQKRGESSTETPAMRTAYIATYILMSASFVAEAFMEGAFVAALGLVLVMWSTAIYRDSERATQLDAWYLSAVVAITVSLPLMANRFVSVLIDNFSQTDALESFATATLLGLFLSLTAQIQTELCKRALPARHRAITLFPIQVFEDVFAEFFFVNSRVYSPGFFVLLAVQVARTLGRDTGTVSELRRAVKNVWRKSRGLAPVPRGDEAVIKWVRVWLQNMVSELTAMFVFVGAIAAEGLRGDDLGSMTGLNPGDRVALLGGYGVVFLFETAAHTICFLVLRRTVIKEQARLQAAPLGWNEDAAGALHDLSIGEEARQLVVKHGSYLLSTLLAVTLLTLAYVRLLRVEYDD